MAIKRLKEIEEKPHGVKVAQEASHEESSHGDDHGGGMIGGSHAKHEEGEGPWLVSYADLMTLLMGFFALIASFSKPDQKEFEKVQQVAAEHFGTKLDQPFNGAEKALKEIIVKENLQDKVKVEASISGLTLTFSGTFFFDSGNFIVKSDAKNVLDRMIVIINNNLKGLSAIIEGHTDPVPISHPIVASNWELSGIRAARVAQLFEKRDFKKDQLTIMGWGETHPEFNNFNADGTANLENQAKNRRVVIKLFKPLPK